MTTGRINQVFRQTINFALLIRIDERLPKASNRAAPTSTDESETELTSPPDASAMRVRRSLEPTPSRTRPHWPVASFRTHTIETPRSLLDRLALSSSSINPFSLSNESCARMAPSDYTFV